MFAVAGHDQVDVPAEKITRELHMTSRTKLERETVWLANYFMVSGCEETGVWACDCGNGKKPNRSEYFS